LTGYFTPATAVDLLASSLPATITFLHVIARYFTDQTEKVFTGTNSALRNYKLMIHYFIKTIFKDLPLLMIFI